MELAAAALGSSLPSMAEIGSAMAADPAMAGVTPGMVSGVSAGSADALGGLGSSTFVPPSIGGISTSSLMKIPSLLQGDGGSSSQPAQQQPAVPATPGNAMPPLLSMIQQKALSGSGGGFNFNPGGSLW